MSVYGKQDGLEKYLKKEVIKNDFPVVQKENPFAMPSEVKNSDDKDAKLQQSSAQMQEMQRRIEELQRQLEAKDKDPNHCIKCDDGKKLL